MLRRYEPPIPARGRLHPWPYLDILGSDISEYTRERILPQRYVPIRVWFVQSNTPPGGQCCTDLRRICLGTVTDADGVESWRGVTAHRAGATPRDEKFSRENN